MSDQTKIAQDSVSSVCGELYVARAELAYLKPIAFAAKALLADVRRRHPGEELTCPFMRALDAAALT